MPKELKRVLSIFIFVLKNKNKTKIPNTEAIKYKVYKTIVIDYHPPQF